MNPVIKYKGKNKHQKIKDREYHTFEIVNILTKDGEEVNKLQQQHEGLQCGKKHLK